MWAYGGHFQLPTAVHLDHSPSSSWVFVSSRSQRDKMAEERAHTTLILFPLCHLRCLEALQSWTRVVLIQGLEEASLLCTPLPPLTPYTASFLISAQQSVSRWWSCSGSESTCRGGLGGERDYVHYVNSTVACIHRITNTASVLITWPHGSNFALWLVMWSRQQT